MGALHAGTLARSPAPLSPPPAHSLARADWWPAPELINLNEASPLNKLEFDAWTFTAQTGPNSWVHDSRTSSEPANATWVMGVARAHVSLSAEVDLHEFPLDEQRVEIIIESANWPMSNVEFRAVPSLKEGVLVEGTTATTAVRGWNVERISIEEGEHYYPTFDQTYSRLSVSTVMARQSYFWTSRVVLGVVLFVTMSIWALALPNEAGGERMLNIITVFLGMVSWEFVIVLESPQLGYNNVSAPRERARTRWAAGSSHSLSRTRDARDSARPP